MMNPETAVNVSKIALAINHIKNNRIEYLALTILAHLIGLTAKAQEHVTGVCG